MSVYFVVVPAPSCCSFVTVFDVASGALLLLAVSRSAGDCAPTQAPPEAATDPTKLYSVWRRGGTGGYTAGALFLIKVHGILINGDRHRFAEGEPVPVGATALRRDQLSMAPSVMEYHSATFDLAQLMHALQSFLDALGYTRELLDALVAVRDYVARRHANPAAHLEVPVQAAEVLRQGVGRAALAQVKRPRAEATICSTLECC